MPYKNPEHKRQWEREHREQRNARRRMQHSAARQKMIVAKPAPDPVSGQKSTSAWKVVQTIGLFALAAGIAVLAALGGASGSGYSTTLAPRRP